MIPDQLAHTKSHSVTYPIQMRENITTCHHNKIRNRWNIDTLNYIYC